MDCSLPVSRQEYYSVLISFRMDWLDLLVVLVFLWLVSLNIMCSASIHVVENGRISSFFMAWNTIFYCLYTTSFVFTHRHLGCFYFLAVVNSAAVHMKVHMSHPTFVFFTLGFFQEVEFLDHIVDLFLTYWDTSIHMVFHSIWTNILPHGYEDYLFTNMCQDFSSVAQLCLTICECMDWSMPGLLVHHQLPEFTQTHVLWVGDAIQPSVIPFSSRLQPFAASGTCQMSQLFTSGGQNIGISASASVLPVNIQDWSPLGWTGWILQSKGFSRVFSNTTVQKHQFFATQLSL